MKEAIIGSRSSAQAEVTDANTAAAMGSGSLPVFATPCMAALMEKAACQCIAPFLDQDETTVGTLLNITHDAATPIGGAVRAECVLTSADGRRLSFKVEAFDGAGRVGGGVHERFVIRSGRFLEKARARLCDKQTESR